MRTKSHGERLAMIVAAVAAAAGAAVVAHGFGIGLGSLHGMQVVVFVLGAVVAAAGAYLVQSTMKRRARIEAIADLLPRYREQLRNERFSFGEAGLDGDLSAGIPTSQAEIRDATRALLVSLEEEVRRDTGHTRRSKRPGCRRARLRMAGRSETARRRVVPRRTLLFS